MLLRRELSRLASQILAVARAQGSPQVQQRMAEVAQTYTVPGAIEEAQAQQEPEQQQEPEEEHWHAGNGAAHEPEMAEAGPEVDAMAEGMAHGGADVAEEPGDDAEEAESEGAEQKSSLARRFVARREARRARKTGGISLSDRLRGLVADRPET